MSDTIKAQIREILRRELALPESQNFSNEDDFTTQMKLDSDDLSFLFVPAIEQHFKKRLTHQQWAQIGTVNDLAVALNTQN